LSLIKSIMPMEDYTLEVTLDNGSNLILYLGGKLHTMRFGMLADKAFFKRATTDGSYIRWGNKIEISINEVIQLAHIKF